MAIIKNLTVRYCRLNPNRPNPKFDQKNPRWDLQVYTDSLEEKERLKAEGLDLRLMKYPEGHEKEGEPMLNKAGKREWKLNINKRSLSKNGEKNKPVEVVSGANQPIDPDSIGDGSIVNCRISTKESTDATGKKRLNITLQGVQVIKHIVFKQREEFGNADYVVVDPTQNASSTDSEDEDDDASGDAKYQEAQSSEQTQPATTPSVPNVNANRKSADY